MEKLYSNKFILFCTDFLGKSWTIYDIRDANSELSDLASLEYGDGECEYGRCVAHSIGGAY